MLLEKYDSSYELARFKALDKSPLVRTWTKRHGIKIPYKSIGKRRRYHPDILVEYVDGRVFLEEVKGMVWDKMVFSLKNLAANSYCVMRGMKYRIIFKEHLEIID